MLGQYLFYALFVLFSSGIGYVLATSVFLMEKAGFMGALLGFLVASLFVLIGITLYRFGTKRLFWGIFGFVLGAAISRLTNGLLDHLLTLSGSASPLLFSSNGLFAAKWVSFCFLTLLGVVIALKVEQEPHFLQQRDAASNNKILDTSVIIDGRIADLCETGFLEGTFIMPHFVLQELQHIADSADTLRRVRGRRGLDILDRLQKMANVDLRILDHDFPSIREVDAKIVALARHLSAKVITNDMNLTKVAGLQGVSVLNMNRLSTALKPIVLPGEIMHLFVAKEGKEAWQGVAYLDDGTMIVIDDAKKSIGKKVDAVVTSVLQTSSGRMIFAKMKETPEPHALEKSA